MNNNQIQFIDLFYPRNLEIIYLQKNQLNFPITIDEFDEFDSYESNLPFEHLHHIKFLDLSFNKLTDLVMIYIYILDNLYQNNTINMQNKNITNIMPYFLAKMAQEKQWDRFQMFQKLNFVFSLENNPINCDCEIFNFWKVVNAKLNVAAIREEILLKLPGEVK